MKIRTKILLALILGGIVALFLTGYVMGKRKGDRASQAVIEAQNKDIAVYVVTIDDLKFTVAEKEQVITTQKEAIKKGDITREEMRKLDIKRVAEITHLKMRIDTLLHIPSNPTVVYVDTCTNKPRPALLLPFTWGKNDQWLSLRDSCDIQGVNHVSLSMDVPIKLIGAVDKGTKKYKVVATTPNTYVRFTDINSDKLDMQKDKKWGIGIIAGYGTVLTAPKLVPFIGIGVSRTIIRF